MIAKIKKFLNRKREKIIESSFKNLKLIEEEWDKFLKKDIYLTHEKKREFAIMLSKKEKLIKTPWYFYFDKKLKNIIDKNLAELETCPRKVLGYNEDFIQQKMKQYTPLFKKSPYPLDENQKRAVIKDDKHNLIVAGAGSGKTETLITRIAYLIKRKSDKIEPKRILALAFQNKESKEIRQRLKERYNLDVEIKTFHALGKKILEDSAKVSKKQTPKLKFTGDNADVKYNAYIKELFNKTERKLHNKIINYLKSFGDDEIEKEEKDF